MGEGVEARLAVAGAHAAVPHPAEGEAGVGQVHHRVVDAPAPEGQGLQHRPLDGAAPGEQVEGQRAGLLPLGLHQLRQAPVEQHRQDGAEDLLLQHRAVLRHVHQHRGGNTQALRVGLPAHGDPPAGQQPGQTVEVPPVDDAGQLLPGQGIRAVKAGDLPGQGGHEGLRHPLRHPDVVRSHAGLPRVEKLAPSDAGRGQLHIGVGGQNHRRPAPQLQGDGGEVLRRRGHDLFPHRRTAGEEDYVEGLVHQGLRLLPSPLGHGDIIRREHPPQHFRHGAGGGGGVLPRLHHSRAPLRDGGHQGGQGEKQRVVPRGEDQRHAVGLPVHSAHGGELGQGGRVPDGTGPLFQMPAGKAQLRQGGAQLAHIPLVGGFVEICLQRLQQLPLPPGEGQLQPGEHLPAEPEGPGGPAVKIPPLGGQYILHGALLHSRASTAPAKA